jgi:predicted GNAT family acetyltransferase
VEGAPDQAEITVADVPERFRYEIAVDGEIAGSAQYQAARGVLALVHTEIDDSFEGRGLAKKLIGFALDDARAKGLEVLPFCPFVRDFIERDRTYVDLVPADRRGDFGL